MHRGADQKGLGRRWPFLSAIRRSILQLYHLLHVLQIRVLFSQICIFYDLGFCIYKGDGVRIRLALMQICPLVAIRLQASATMSALLQIQQHGTLSEEHFPTALKRQRLPKQRSIKKILAFSLYLSASLPLPKFIHFTPPQSPVSLYICSIGRSCASSSFCMPRQCFACLSLLPICSELVQFPSLSWLPFPFAVTFVH